MVSSPPSYDVPLPPVPDNRILPGLPVTWAAQFWNRVRIHIYGRGVPSAIGGNEEWKIAHVFGRAYVVLERLEELCISTVWFNQAVELK